MAGKRIKALVYSLKADPIRNICGTVDAPGHNREQLRSTSCLRILLPGFIGDETGGRHACGVRHRAMVADRHFEMPIGQPFALDALNGLISLEVRRCHNLYQRFIDLGHLNPTNSRLGHDSS